MTLNQAWIQVKSGELLQQEQINHWKNYTLPNITKRGIQTASSSILHASVEMDEYHYTNTPENVSKIVGPDRAPDTKGEALPSATLALHEGSLKLQAGWKQQRVPG